MMKLFRKKTPEEQMDALKKKKQKLYEDIIKLAQVARNKMNKIDNEVKTMAQKFEFKGGKVQAVEQQQAPLPPREFVQEQGQQFFQEPPRPRQQQFVQQAPPINVAPPQPVVQEEMTIFVVQIILHNDKVITIEVPEDKMEEFNNNIDTAISENSVFNTGNLSINGRYISLYQVNR